MKEAILPEHYLASPQAWLLFTEVRTKRLFPYES